MDIINQNDTLAPTENLPETSEALRVDSSLDDFPSKLDINTETNEIIYHCYVNNLVNPVEMLLHMQNILVQGRPLEVLDPATYINGATSFTMDRFNLLKTGLEEIGMLENRFVCLEVQFYDEVNFNLITKPNKNLLLFSLKCVLCILFYSYVTNQDFCVIFTITFSLG